MALTTSVTGPIPLITQTFKQAAELDVRYWVRVDACVSGIFASLIVCLHPHTTVFEHFYGVNYVAWNTLGPLCSVLLGYVENQGVGSLEKRYCFLASPHIAPGGPGPRR